MLKINDILRAQYVKRWHICATLTSQSLAEHTFNTVMIARAIAKEVKEDDYEIIKGALLHDLDEIVNGDIPSTTKRRFNESGIDLSIAYARHTGRKLTRRQVQIVKNADFIEAIWFMYHNSFTAHGQACLDDVRDHWYAYRAGCDEDIGNASARVQKMTLSKEVVI